MSTLELFIPITKVDEDKRLVTGLATSEALDSQGQIMDYQGTKDAYNRVYKGLGSIREMHDSTKAAGVATQVLFDDVNKTVTLESHIVDDQAWAKVKHGVYKGYSVGGRSREIVKELTKGADGEADVEIERVMKWDWRETSLVDQPANPDAHDKLTLVKMAPPFGESAKDDAEDAKDGGDDEAAEGEAPDKKKKKADVPDKGNPFASKKSADEMVADFRALSPEEAAETLAKFTAALAELNKAQEPPTPLAPADVENLIALSVGPVLTKIAEMAQEIAELTAAGQTVAKVDFNSLAKAAVVTDLSARLEKIEAMPSPFGAYRNAIPVSKGRETPDEEGKSLAKSQMESLALRLTTTADPKAREIIGQEMALLELKTGVS